MVNHPYSLDRIFSALGHATRRSILLSLEAEDGLSISGLARPLGMKLPAMLKHLDVLEEASLITRRKVGRTVHVHLAPEPMVDATRWLQKYERFWPQRLDRLVAHVEAKQRKAGGPGA